MSNESQDRVQEQAREAIRGSQGQHRGRQFALWMGALIIGAILGWLGIPALNQLFDFIATVFTRLFQFIAVPTIALAVITTLSALGAKKETGRIFAHAVTYTLLTTICAAAIGLVLYLWIAPGNLPVDLINSGVSNVPQKLEKVTYYDHFLSVIPNNMLQPFLSGNVLSVMLIAAAVGLALAFMPKTENRAVLLKGLLGLQEVLFTLIRALLWILPVGILAFSAQLSAQIEAGVIVGALGKYTLVILGGNLIQFFIVLPICTTINMNGCAAFILVTSLFLMQNGGFDLSIGTMIAWLFVAVLAAVGNAGVPMGCYFLTLSLMSGIGAPIGIMGIILPIYTIIDMIETAENVWSDSAVCAMTDHDLASELDAQPAPAQH